MNHLSEETSPYLLQHTYNPVDWYAWKPEALDKAKQEDKPILVSIGYSTCHWCHVMERESFVNEEIAQFMNTHFVNIKIDREERPDLDQIYMEACMAINGSGGWPLNCFLTPDGRPFFAGTYYPPESKYNRPSWLQLLMHMEKVFREERDKVEKQADQLAELVRSSNKSFFSEDLSLEVSKHLFTPELAHQILEAFQKKFDPHNGGFGAAPKFPMAIALNYLLQFYTLTGNEEALSHLELSMQKMINGGIYDQIGGGFARYATDEKWLVPHFEKMLYDNALIIETLADLYRIKPQKSYLKALKDSLQFVERELMHIDGGFYAALDADSEGVEGKYYVWSKQEVEEVLKEEAPLFCAFFGVTKEGNWEHSNILWKPFELDEFAQHSSFNVADLEAQLQKNLQQLFKKREERIRPGLDHKILLGWNALMCKAYVKAYQATGIAAYKAIALKNFQFIDQHFVKPDGSYFHVAAQLEGKWILQYAAFLDDYAYWIEALLALYTIDFDKGLIRKAADLSEYVLKEFFDEARNLFYFTSRQQEDIPIRKIEVIDNAIPSGNAVMLSNFMDLFLLTGEDRYRIIAEGMASQIMKGLQKYPSSFAKWAQALLKFIYPVYEIAIIGPEAKDKAKQLLRRKIHHFLVMASEEGDEQFPLLASKATKAYSLIYICQNFSCERPVVEIDEAEKRLTSFRTQH